LIKSLQIEKVKIQAAIIITLISRLANQNGNSDWHIVPLKSVVLDVVARLSSRIFMGAELCRDPSWLKISAEYTVCAMQGIREMRSWNPAVRPIVHWFLPSCRKLRSMVKEARKIVNGVLEKRRADQAAGITSLEHNDALKWFEDQAKGRPYDPTVLQIALVFVSSHTTTDLLTQVLFDLAQHPELIEPLRKEAISVLREGGWKGLSQHNLKLLDSVIKETQRLKPIGISRSRHIPPPPSATLS
jgi:cytochrome P450